MSRGRMRPARVVERARLAEGLAIVKLRLLEPLGEEPRPPQFAMVWVPGLESVPMSIASYDGEHLTLIVRPVGPTTRRLSEVRSGEVLGVKGPLGSPLPLDEHDEVLVVAGGSGIAVAHAVARYLKGRSRCVIAYGARSASDVGAIPVVLERLGAEVHVSTDDGSYGFKGTAVDLAEALGAERFSLVVACGPEGMLRATARRLKGLGDRLVLVVESMVKCGLGVCGSCEVPGTGLLLCRDGPGLPLSALRGWLEVR